MDPIDPTAVRKLLAEISVYCFVFDLLVCEGFDLHQVSRQAGLESYSKTSGTTGLYILILLHPIYGYQDVLYFTKILSRLTVKGIEERATLEHNPEKREGKIDADSIQNGREKPFLDPTV